MILLYNAAEPFSCASIGENILWTWFGIVAGIIFSIWKKTDLIQTEIETIKNMLQQEAKDSSQDGKERRPHD